MSTPTDPKRALRAQIRAALRDLTPEQRGERSQRACAVLAGWPRFAGARSVLVFLSMDYEIDTTPLIEAALAAGKLVGAPWIDPRTRAMQFAHLDALDHTTLGFGGIREPISRVPVDPAAAGLIVVPALAFDRETGVRLGHGGGYYDRLLTGAGQGVTTCGLGLDLQRIVGVPAEPHDTGVGALATDAGLFEFGRPRPEPRH